MYRTTSLLALGLFLGLAPVSLHAQQDTQQQETQQQDTQQQETQQQDTQQQDTQQQETQEQPQQSAGLLSADEGTLLVDTMIGADVYSTSDEDETVGSIDDVVITVDGQVEGVIIGVGGWLGVGQRDVLVSMDDLSLEARDDELRLVMQRTREELEEEPEFQRAEEQRRAQTGVVAEQEQPGTFQQDPALIQADQELQQAERAIQDADGEEARERLQQARQQLEQAHQQAQGEQQEALQQSNDSLQQADQAIQDNDAQQAQQSVQQAREQLQIAMQNIQQQGTAQQDTAQQDTAQQDTAQQDTAQQDTAQQDTAQQDTAQQDTAQQEMTQPEDRDGQIVFQDEDSIMASTMIGTEVQVGDLEDNEELGQISDVIVSMDGQVHGVVIGVGGFLGIGEKDVIVSMDNLDIQRTGDDQVLVSVLQTREELEAAEGFERPQQ